MNKTFLLIAGILGLLTVAFGAFGAHALKEKLSPEQLHTFETAVKYQFYHTLALLLLSLPGDKLQGDYFQASAWLFIAGVILFSGSLYLLSCRDLLGLSNWKWLGPVTPIGGLAFIAGWFFLILAALKKL